MAQQRVNSAALRELERLSEELGGYVEPICDNCGDDACPEPSNDWVSRRDCERRAKEKALAALADMTLRAEAAEQKLAVLTSSNEIATL